MYSYVGYGLGIHSDLLLSELVAGEAGADVVVRLDKLEGRLPEAGSLEYGFWATAEGTYLFWEDVGTLLVRGGNEIIIDPVPGVEERRLRLFLLGAAMGVLHHQRGQLVLHASAIDIDGGAVLFLGGRGWGKSTMAAALHGQGHRVLCDDVVALELNGGGVPTVSPGFPQLKLWPDVVAALGVDPESLPRLSSRFDKRHFQANNGFCNAPAPVRHIIVLRRGPSLAIEHLQPQQALIELLRHLYVARFGSLLLRQDEAPHLLQCAEVVRNVPVDLLNRPQSLPLVSAAARLVERHLALDVYRATA
ncbi:MAG: hypothetical protein O7D33_07340 [Chloroflexi bacterium]|nr:hypothetical protein [Chloroflexota bacterium]